MKKLQYYNSLGKIAFIFLIGMAIFFFSAYLVVSISTGSRGSYQIENYTNKFYTEIHNDLSRNIKIKLRYVYIPDKAVGLVLSQSLSPGSFVEKEKSTITLTINRGVNQIKIPKLEGRPLSYAVSAVKGIPVGKYQFNLELGPITYLGDVDEKDTDEKKASNMVLQQWPPGDALVALQQKVHLLVSGFPPNNSYSKKKKINKLPNLLGVNYSFAWIFIRKNFPSLKIETETIAVDKGKNLVNAKYLSGEINKQSIKAGTSKKDLYKKTIKLTFYYFPSSKRFYWDFDKLTYNIPEKGKYKIEIRNPKNLLLYKSNGTYKENQILNLFLNRKGRVIMRVYKTENEEEKLKEEKEIDYEKFQCAFLFCF